MINDTLKTLCELGVIEKKPSNDKSSYILIDNINIGYSQPHITTIMVTPIIEKSTSAEILSERKLTPSLPETFRIMIGITQRH